MPRSRARPVLLRVPPRQGYRAAQIVVGLYGQSNMGFFTIKGSSPPAANAGTTFFDGAKWGAVPAANGIRELLNGINNATGKTVGAFNGAVAGQTIAQLSKGNPNLIYPSFVKQLRLSGCVVDFIAMCQGEADSANGTVEATWIAYLSRLHYDICAEANLSKPQCPLVISSLGCTTDPTGEGTDASWDGMQRAILDASAQLPSLYYSHSNRDATYDDSVHLDAVSQGRSGKRFAKTISELYAKTTGYPNWHIASAATVDATHTDVTFALGIGTDFTPTTNPSGFEVSGDNGGTWAAPSSSARQSATVLRLTHSSIATTNARKLRYQYGRTPDVSAPVADNSSLVLPLDNSAGNISPTPLAVLPTPSYITATPMGSGGGTSTETKTALNLGTAAQDLLLICGVTGAGATVTSATITPSGGGAINATVVRTDGTTIGCSILQFAIPNGTDLTNATLVLNLSAAPSTLCDVGFWTVNVSDLSSTTAVGSNSAVSASAQTVSTTLATSSGGFVIAVAVFGAVGANTLTFSGTESYSRRYERNENSRDHSGGDSSGNSTNASSTVTAAWTQAASSCRVTAVSWR
jgi:hypothetical protein